MVEKKLKVAAVQARPGVLDLSESLARTHDWAGRAAAEGARVVVFPESWLGGYPAWLDVSPGAALWDHEGAKAVFGRLVDTSIEVPSDHCQRLADIARTHRVCLVVGVHERAGRTLYNTLLTFAPDGTLANHHRKLVPTYSERMVWGSGDGAGLGCADIDSVRVGGLVCWEHWMPLARQALHDDGEQIHAAVWPWAKDMNLVASRHYAFEGRCFVVVAGAIMRREDLPAELPAAGRGAADELLLRGGSAVIAPDGRFLAAPLLDREALVTAECDLGEIARESLTLDVSGHYSRPDVFRFEVRRGRP